MQWFECGWGSESNEWIGEYDCDTPGSRDKKNTQFLKQWRRKQEEEVMMILTSLEI